MSQQSLLSEPVTPQKATVDFFAGIIAGMAFAGRKPNPQQKREIESAAAEVATRVAELKAANPR